MKLLKKRWFWLVIILILIFSIIFDLIILNVWAVYQVSHGQWDMRLLLVAGLLIVSDVLGSVSKKWKLKFKSLSRLVFIILIISGIVIHGFWNGIVFMSMILILSRLIRITIWVIKKGIAKYRRRGLLEEI